jgi:hypothetical protein
MCCAECCDRRRDAVDEHDLRIYVRDTIDGFPFGLYGVSVSPLDGRMDARIETWKQALIDEIIDDVKMATHES